MLKLHFQSHLPWTIIYLMHADTQHFKFDSASRKLCWSRIMYLEGWFLSLLLGDIVGDICHSLHTNFITPHQPSPIFIPEPTEEKCQVEKCHFALNSFTLSFIIFTSFHAFSSTFSSTSRQDGFVAFRIFSAFTWSGALRNFLPKKFSTSVSFIA